MQTSELRQPIQVCGRSFVYWARRAIAQGALRHGMRTEDAHLCHPLARGLQPHPSHFTVGGEELQVLDPPGGARRRRTFEAVNQIGVVVYPDLAAQQVAAIAPGNNLQDVTGTAIANGAPSIAEIVVPAADRWLAIAGVSGLPLQYIPHYLGGAPGAPGFLDFPTFARWWLKMHFGDHGPFWLLVIAAEQFVLAPDGE